MKQEYKIKGYMKLEKQVTVHGNSSKVLLPKSWLGCDVVVVFVRKKR